MKIVRICISVLVLSVLSGTALAAGNDNKNMYPVKTCGGAESSNPLRIIGFRDYPPFSWAERDEEYFQKNGVERFTYHGFIMDALKRSLFGIHIRNVRDIVADSMEKVKKAMMYGRVDLFFTSYYVNDSQSGQDYVYPAYFGNPFMVVSRKTRKIDVKDASGLKGLKGVVRREEEIEPLLRGILPTDTKLEVVDGAETAFRKLLSGDVDFMITSPYAADAEARRFKVKDKLHFGKQVIRHIKYFVAFSKKSQCRRYKDVFSQKFQENYNKAELEKGLQKYIDLWVEKFADAPALEYTPAVDEPPVSEVQKNDGVKD